MLVPKVLKLGILVLRVLLPKKFLLEELKLKVLVWGVLLPELLLLPEMLVLVILVPKMLAILV